MNPEQVSRYWVAETVHSDKELRCTLLVLELTQDLQVKVHAVLSGLVDGLARVFPGILLLHPGNL